MTERDALYFGALLHDIGKLYQRGDDEYQYIHHQILSTSFMQELLGNPLINAIVKNHHKPDLLKSELSGQKRALAEIVCLADSLASGERTDDKSIGGQEALHSIFNQIKIGNKKQPILHYQPLSRLNPADYQFPTTQSPNLSAYEAIWESCKKELALAKDNPETVLQVYKKHLWAVPSSSWLNVPDVSLYEHSRLTAAIALCLYDFFEQPIETPFNLYDEQEERFLLVCGDLTGIQKFIYNIAHKGALKALKGRSFYLQHLVDVLARNILDDLNIPLCNLIYATGGKFYILLPNTKTIANYLTSFEKETAEWLLKQYDGELGLVLGKLPLAAFQFNRPKDKDEPHPFSKAWSQLNVVTAQNKRQKFASIINPDFFEPFGAGGETIRCYNTGKDLCSVNDKNKGLNNTFFADGDNFISAEQKMAQGLGINLKKGKWLCEDFFQETTDGVRTRFVQKGEQYPIAQKLGIKLSDTPNGKRAWKLNDDDFLLENTNALGWKFYGGNYSIQHDFESLAEEGIGIKQLAVLRMDVDNLGLIFKEGLGGNATFSRIVQLSAMLEFFFCGYLNQLHELRWDSELGIQGEVGVEVRDLLQIVYAGGDDLFLVGVWHIVPDVASWIYKQFKAFTGNHPSFSISAGISLFSSGVPIFKVAELAGEAEKEAKNLNNKDAVSFLNTPLKWNDFEGLREKAFKYKKWVTEGVEGKNLPRGFLQHIQTLSEMKQEEIRKLNAENEKFKRGWTPEEVEEKSQFGKWRWIAAYSIARLGERNKSFKELLANEASEVFQSPQKLNQFALAARWAELLTR